VFKTIDEGNDLIRPAAFKKTIKERHAAGKIKTMYNHYDLIGRPDVLKEDDHGLFSSSTISSTSRGDEVLTLVADGVLTDMSFGYRTMKYETVKGDGRELLELKLYEVSFVDWGMNELAEITGIKSMERLINMIDKSGGNLDFKTIDLLRTTIQRLQELAGDDPHQQSSAVNAALGEIGPLEEMKKSAVDVVEWAKKFK
jgi:HK97 family phage prohead protease